jgi:dolichol-phosphate mannosyltransferase
MKALVIIPTFNEIHNIEKIIEAIFSIDSSLEILIVDDGSTDGTRQIVVDLVGKDSRVHLLPRERKMGLGSAYIAGFKYAVEKGYDFVFEMDADFSHDPKDLKRFLEKIRNCDLVVGSRYLNGVSVVNWPMSRLLLSFFANIYARIITGVPIQDLTSGFKCYRREVLEAIDLNKIHSDGYGFQIEMDVKAFRKGFRVKEMPIVFVERRAGTSKMSRHIVWEAFWLVWRLRFQSLFRRI